MLAEILAANQHPVMDSFKGFDMNEFIPRGGQDIRELNAGDSAEWAAGVMYAYTGQTVDVRDALVECSTQVEKLDLRLGRAYKRYGKGKYQGGNKAIKNSERFYRESTAGCDDDIK